MIFGVEVRYPDNFLMPSLEEAHDYLKIASDLKSIVLKKILL